MGIGRAISLGARLQELFAKERFLAVGLMSGTSMDGIDAALVKLEADSRSPNVELVAFNSYSYPDELKTTLMEIASGGQCTAEDIASLHTSVAVGFANGFFSICREAGVESVEVDYIASHGQTVAHVPPAPGSARVISGTLQLGPPGVIAALTGVTTVGDFRVADMALGGQGAPLAPYVDYLIRRSASRSRIILNLGGIANLTFLPKNCGPEELIAFDTGPGNMILDELHRVLYPGQGPFDEAGEKARRGEPAHDVVDKFLNFDYFERKPPKSAGHRDFGTRFAWEFLSICEAKGLRREDILATAVELTARSVQEAVERFVKPQGEVQEIYLSGGGSRNAVMVDRLKKLLAPAGVHPIDELGIPADAKEAVDFAVLGRETLLARQNVIAGATGAAKGTVLGTIAVGGAA